MFLMIAALGLALGLAKVWKDSSIVKDLLVLMVAPLVTLCVQRWAYGLQQHVVESENQDKHVPPHLDPTPPIYDNSEMDDRTPPRIIQAMTFFHSYCVVRIVCSERLWQGTWGGKEGQVFDMAWIIMLVAACLASFYLQISLQSSCVVQLGAVLALPPFFDSQNKLLAKRIGKLTPPTHKDIAEDAAALASIGADMSREHARAVGLVDKPWKCDFCEEHFTTMEACQEHERPTRRCR